MFFFFLLQLAHQDIHRVLFYCSPKPHQVLMPSSSLDTSWLIHMLLLLLLVQWSLHDSFSIFDKLTPRVLFPSLHPMKKKEALSHLCAVILFMDELLLLLLLCCCYTDCTLNKVPRAWRFYSHFCWRRVGCGTSTFRRVSGINLYVVFILLVRDSIENRFKFEQVYKSFGWNECGN